MCQISQIRPDGFVHSDKVLEVIEHTINSILECKFSSKNIEEVLEKIGQLYELIEVVIQMKWRYGNNNVIFKFTTKTDFPDATPVSEFVSTFWHNRIWIIEDEFLTKIFINF